MFMPKIHITHVEIVSPKIRTSVNFKSFYLSLIRKFKVSEVIYRLYQI